MVSPENLRTSGSIVRRQHLTALKLQGLSEKTIDVYARAVRRVSERFECCPDQLSQAQLTTCFAELVDSHSWSTVKVDRNDLRVIGTCGKSRQTPRPHPVSEPDSAHY
jgi:hypothetical protein